MWEELAEWDRQAFVFLNNLGVEDYDVFWIFITQPRHWIPLYIIFIGLLLYFLGWKKGILATLLLIFDVLVTVGFTALVKANVARLRPGNQPLLENLIRVVQEPHNFSFFSGHAASSFTVTTFMVLVLQTHFRWVYLFYLWPILFTLSRIFVGVHYPADVLVGAGVGILIALLFYWVFKQSLIRYGDHYFLKS